MTLEGGKRGKGGAVHTRVSQKKHISVGVCVEKDKEDRGVRDRGGCDGERRWLGF